MYLKTGIAEVLWDFPFVVEKKLEFATILQRDPPRSSNKKIVAKRHCLT
jgi:hypothetical protein